MPNLNKTFLMGHLVRDPELKYTPSGAALCKFSLATTRKFKLGDKLESETLFIDVTAWGKMGENCSQYLAKGSAVFVEGHLKLEQWESQGQKRSKIILVAENIQFLTNRESVKPQRDIPGCDEDSIPF